MHEFIQKQTESIISLLVNNLDIKASLATKLGELFMLLMLVIVSYLAYWITVKLLRGLIIPILQRTKTQFDDLLVKHHFFRNIAFLVRKRIKLLCGLAFGH